MPRPSEFGPGDLGDSYLIAPLASGKVSGWALESDQNLSKNGPFDPNLTAILPAA